MKPETILLLPTDGKSFADVLATIRKDVKYQSLGVEIGSMKKTRGREVLLELGKSYSRKAKSAFSEVLEQIVGTQAQIKELGS